METYRIKPLKWIDNESGPYKTSVAFIISGKYVVRSEHNEKFITWCIDMGGLWPMYIPQECSSIAEGKRLAEEHWHSRIKEALEVVDEQGEVNRISKLIGRKE